MLPRRPRSTKPKISHDDALSTSKGSRDLRRRWLGNKCLFLASIGTHSDENGMLLTYLDSKAMVSTSHNGLKIFWGGTEGTPSLVQALPPTYFRGVTSRATSPPMQVLAIVVPSPTP